MNQSECFDVRPTVTGGVDTFMGCDYESGKG